VDERRFDTWTRAWARPGSRRRLLRGLAGGGALLAVRQRFTDVAAHHRTAGPGDPCRKSSQCLGADAPLVCDWNGHGKGLHCCTYEGSRCGFDAACCGTALCIGDYCSS
jgi:hypothetical protein